MKPSQVRILASLALPLAITAKMHDFDRGDGKVFELDETHKWSPERNEVVWDLQGLTFRFSCPEESGQIFSFSKDEKYLACCQPGQHISGAPGSFECCGEGHDVSGSKEAGYTCCPTGQTFDGDKCHQPTPVCDNGKILVDGECACPPGTEEDADGNCKQAAECESGIKEGKCYTLRMENGELLGYNTIGWYSASKGSRNHMFGKFKFCKTEACDGSSPIDPDDGFRILDLHGDSQTGARRNHWLDDRSNGGHITKTPDYKKAGVFSVTKWTCGKYCLTGFDNGLGPTCPSNDPAITFLTKDKQACQPVEIVEVPCDIRDNSNNCLWEKGPNVC